MAGLPIDANRGNASKKRAEIAERSTKKQVKKDQEKESPLGWVGAESDGSQPVDASLPFSLPLSSSSSSSSISALTFVSASSSRSYLLKTFVDLTSPLRSVLLREVETVQSASPYTQ